MFHVFFWLVNGNTVLLLRPGWSQDKALLLHGKTAPSYVLQVHSGRYLGMSVWRGCVISVTPNRCRVRFRDFVGHQRYMEEDIRHHWLGRGCVNSEDNILCWIRTILLKLVNIFKGESIYQAPP